MLFPDEPKYYVDGVTQVVYSNNNKVYTTFIRFFECPTVNTKVLSKGFLFANMFCFLTTKKYVK